MKLTDRIALSLLALLVPAAVAAQGSSPQVTVAPINTVVVTRGGKAALDIALQVNRGFHVNSNKPNDELLLPTVVHLNPPQGIMIVNVEYPEGQELALPFMGNQKLSVYSGNFAVSAEVRIPKSAPLGTQRVHGNVKYQACDNRQCYPPREVPVEFDVKVQKPGKISHAQNPAQSPHVH